MNHISVSITQPNTVKYPLHQHNTWEIMYYLSGTGHLATAEKQIPFHPGVIVIVPPRVVHGSVSEDGFVNISIRRDLSHVFLFEKPERLLDNAAGEGGLLAKLVLENRYASAGYLSALCSAYIQFLLQNVNYESRISRTVAQMISEITERFSDPEFRAARLLKESGYAADYVRAEFKRVTSLTPVQFLTQTRVDHARKLLEIYGSGIRIAELSDACGFEDPVYFSKRFKQLVGLSPDEYRRKNFPNPL